MKKIFTVSNATQTKTFYDNLMDGKEERGIWGRERRFDAERVRKKKSVQKYFIDVIKNYLYKDAKVLDVGCGSGGFLAALSPYCRHITGIEISTKLVEACKSTIERIEISNANVIQVDGISLPFSDNSMDVLLMVDVIHHMENIHTSLDEVMRVVKRGGRILVFEPNKLNPLLAFMCLLDRNERGLLKLGTKKKYISLLSRYAVIETIQYNSLLIGPESKSFLVVADFLSKGAANTVLGWLCPKIFISASKL